MKTLFLLSLLSLSSPLIPFSQAACSSKHGGKAEAAAPLAAGSTAEAPRGHPLKGVIVAVLGEKSALLVKHEEIPGVMKAMTMLLKVDAPTLAAAKKDQAITATLVRKADGWWLENVQPVPMAE
jgi:hypothetical protein